MIITDPSYEVFDALGKRITIGGKIVVANRFGRQFERTVKHFEIDKMLEGTEKEWDWVNVRFEGGGSAVPDQCAVVVDDLFFQVDPDIINLLKGSQTIELKKGSSYVVQMQSRMSQADMNVIMRYLSEMHTGCQFIIFDGGAVIQELDDEILRKAGLVRIPEPTYCERCGGELNYNPYIYGYRGNAHGPGFCIERGEQSEGE